MHRWEEGTGKYWEEGVGSIEHPVLVGIFLEQVEAVAASAASTLKAVGVAVKDSQREVGVVYCIDTDTDNLCSSYKQLV